VILRCRAKRSNLRRAAALVETPDVAQLHQPALGRGDREVLHRAPVVAVAAVGAEPHVVNSPSWLSLKSETMAPPTSTCSVDAMVWIENAQVAGAIAVHVQPQLRLAQRQRRVHVRQPGVLPQLGDDVVAVIAQAGEGPGRRG